MLDVKGEPLIKKGRSGGREQRLVSSTLPCVPILRRYCARFILAQHRRITGALWVVGNSLTLVVHVSIQSI